MSIVPPGLLLIARRNVHDLVWEDGKDLFLARNDEISFLMRLLQ